MANDPLTEQIAAYVQAGRAPSPAALEVAWLALFDALGCAMAATRVPECLRLIAPLVPCTVAQGGIPIVGTAYIAEPLSAAFGTGCLVRWLDFSDTWVALETGHPSDHIGTLLAAALYESGRRQARGEDALTVADLLHAMVAAYEIQGILGLTNHPSGAGFDHAAFVRVPSAAVAAKLLGADERQIAAAVSHAWCDGHPLRVYRQAPNAGPRKSWAGPDASARGLQLAFRVLAGALGCGTVLTDPIWGMEARQFNGKAFTLARPLGSYVMENLLFKAAYPGVVHAQTALEAAIALHPAVRDRLDTIDRIRLRSYATAIRITRKSGPLANPADRDHCLQYMVALGLLKGQLSEDDFLDSTARDPRINALRDRMVVEEDPGYTSAFLDPTVRACANSIQITFQDGSCTERVEILQPIGHASRRTEGLPYLRRKLERNLALTLPDDRTRDILATFEQGWRRALPLRAFLHPFCASQ
jgi:2-methylcitrate dehydratase